MEKREKLINALVRVATAINADTIVYDWSKPHSCNCGVVAQALLDVKRGELEEAYKPYQSRLSQGNVSISWKNAVRYFCPISGERLPEIFQRLQDAGLSPADIAHLEYLENPAILAASSIPKFDAWRHPFMYLEARSGNKKPGRFFYEYRYFAKRENLYLYLTAWIGILKGETKETTPTSNHLQLEAQLLLAVADEDFETAARLRDELLQAAR